jgi:hypothetical protein
MFDMNIMFLNPISPITSTCTLLPELVLVQKLQKDEYPLLFACMLGYQPASS